MKTDERRIERVLVTLTPQEKERLKEMAGKKKLPMTDYIRFRLFGGKKGTRQ